MEPIRFTTTIRYWRPEKASGLAVADIPETHVSAIGGLKQQKVQGSIAGTKFASNVMPAGGGRLALSVSKGLMKDAGISIGDDLDVEITSVGRE